MNTTLVLLQFVLCASVGGLIATLSMTLFMNLITKSGLTNADMVRAIGSVLTGSERNAFSVGILIHLLSGVGFAMAYVLLFNFFQLDGWFQTMGVGLSLGFVHGFVLSFLLVVFVAEHHPIERFRNAGFGVAGSHIIGHIVYGGVLGLIVGLSGFRTWMTNDEMRAQLKSCEATSGVASAFASEKLAEE